MDINKIYDFLTHLNSIYVIIAGGGIGSLITWLLNRKTASVNLEAQRLDNLEKSVAVYNVIIEGFKLQIDSLQTKVIILTEQITKIEIENFDLKKKLKDLS